jgi:hypothetical protein
MLSNEQLDDALRSALHELVSEVSPSSSLQDKVSQIGKPARRRGSLLLAHPRVLVGAVASGLTIAVAALISLVPGAVTPSYAVTVNPGRSVRVTLYEITGIGGANARLRALGVRARIVPMTATCKSRLDLAYIGVSAKPTATISITLPIPRGSTDILAARQLRGNKFETALGRTNGTPPTCASTKGSGPAWPPPPKTGSS